MAAPMITARSNQRRVFVYWEGAKRDQRPLAIMADARCDPARPAALPLRLRARGRHEELRRLRALAYNEDARAGFVDGKITRQVI